MNDFGYPSDPVTRIAPEVADARTYVDMPVRVGEPSLGLTLTDTCTVTVTVLRTDGEDAVVRVELAAG